MTNEQITARLEEVSGGGLRLMEPMSAHTSFRIGGPARYFVSPKSEEEAVLVLRFLREEEIPFAVIGNGTNLLVSDEGFDGCVVHIGKEMSGITVAEDGIIEAEAGALLSQIAQAALHASLRGFAFAAGIPGSLGGALMMNAGAYGGEMKDVLIDARVLAMDGSVRTVPLEEMGLGYRRSGFRERNEVVLSGRIRLEAGDPDMIRAEMEDLAERRREKQPLTEPSAGSTFKRPEGYFAGKLIADAGLKGFRIGGACVSEKHAGFVVNKGGATAADVKALIAEVRKVVLEKYGVLLEPEVRFL